MFVYKNVSIGRARSSQLPSPTFPIRMLCRRSPRSSRKLLPSGRANTRRGDQAFLFVYCFLDKDMGREFYRTRER